MEIPFDPDRTDATREQTDVECVQALKPKPEGVRNNKADGHERPAESSLGDKADLLTLRAPEMTVQVGGMQALDANYRAPDLGVVTDQPGTLRNDGFVNLLDMDYGWERTAEFEDVFGGGIATPANSSGGPSAWTSSSGASPGSGPSPRSRAVTTARRSSCVTSWTRGTR